MKVFVVLPFPARGGEIKRGWVSNYVHYIASAMFYQQQATHTLSLKCDWRLIAGAITRLFIFLGLEGDLGGQVITENRNRDG